MVREISITSKDELSEDQIAKIKSYFSDIAVGIISGFGEQGYKAALELAIERF